MGADNIKVVARFRPINKREKKEAELNEITDVEVAVFDPKEPTSIAIRDEITGKKEYAFDRVYDYNSQQDDVYNFVGKPTVDNILKGYNSTIFAYGQTGAG